MRRSKTPPRRFVNLQTHKRRSTLQLEKLFPLVSHRLQIAEREFSSTNSNLLKVNWKSSDLFCFICKMFVLSQTGSKIVNSPPRNCSNIDDVNIEQMEVLNELNQLLKTVHP